MKRAAVMVSLLLAFACGRHKSDPLIHVAAAQGSLGHMPVALAHALGFFEQARLPVSMELLPGTKTLEALLAGSADAVGGVYEQTLQLAADGQRVQSFVLLTARDSRGLVVAPNRPAIRTLGDLRGRTIGVAGLGSATQTFAAHLLLRHGVRPEDASFVGIGMGRTGIAAIERGMVDAAALASGDFIHIRTKYPQLFILADTTTPAGSKAIYGTEMYPGVAFLAKTTWLESHAAEAKRLAQAVQRTLRWLGEHSPAEIRAKLPPEYRTEDEALDLEALRVMKTIYSRDGVMPAEGPVAVRNALATTQEKIRGASIDLSQTYTNEFIREKTR